MILFYNKKTGEIFATIDGRVHCKEHAECFITNGLPKKQIGKLIIGWTETGEKEEVEIKKENFVKQKNGLYKKVIVKKKIQRDIRKDHNLDKFKLLQKFEDSSPTSPLDYKIDLSSKSVIIKKNK